MRRVLLLSALCLVIATVGTGVATAQATVTVITLNDLRLRSGPGTQYDIVTVIPSGTTLTATARNDASNWVRVDFNGQTGWLFVQQLSIRGQLSSLPTGDANTSSAPPPPPNGAIEVLDRYVSTGDADYYHLVYWSDGLRISGFYAEPKGDGTFPAVIYNRSGNRGTGALTGTELAPFAESGFVVVASQLRGMPGGEGADEFGGADVHDVINLISLLKSRPKVDPRRIAMFGASRGGMETYLALKWQSQNGARDIKVAATVGGIADLLMWSAQRPDLANGFYPEMIGVSPSQTLRPFVDRSATYWPQLIRVPILLQHGEADDTVSIQQSRKLYNLLRASGRTAKLITYPGGDHSLAAFEAGLPEVMKWFQKYIARSGDNFDWNVHREAIYNAINALRR
jgi:uncharacterized protein YraI/fermentation-respiration switch protein FrsA (DUF1100 family)